MPGYFVHIASAADDIRVSDLGLKGLIAPDLWKKSTPTKEEYTEFFNNCEGAPSYEQILLLCSLTHGGTHFGSRPGDTNHADFKLIKSLLSSGQLDERNMFFKGYVHHLRVDHDFYADESICNSKAFNADYANDAKLAMDTLHMDWDKTNQALATWYPEVKDIVSSMPINVQKVIGFAEGETKYVFLTPMHNFVEVMRKHRALYELLEP